jgi:hypothetical protein
MVATLALPRASFNPCDEVQPALGNSHDLSRRVSLGMIT